MIQALVTIGKVLASDMATASVHSMQDIAASPVIRANTRSTAQVAGRIIVLHFANQFGPGRSS